MPQDPEIKDSHRDRTLSQPTYLNALARELQKEMTGIEAVNPIDAHAKSLLERLAGTLKTDQTESSLIAIQTPSDVAREKVVETILSDIQTLQVKKNILVVSEIGKKIPQDLPHIHFTGWKDIESAIDPTSSLGLIIVDQNEPISDKQRTELQRLVAPAPIIVFETAWKSSHNGATGGALTIKGGVEQQILRPTQHRSVVTPISGANQAARAWFASGLPINDAILGRLAHDSAVIETVADAVRAFIEEETHAVCFVQAVDARQTREILAELKLKLRPDVASRVATILDPKNLSKEDRQTILNWEGGRIPVLVSSAISSHTRAPDGLRAVFMQLHKHLGDMETLLGRALQPGTHGQLNPVVIVELSPCKHPQDRGYVSPISITGGVSLDKKETPPPPVVEEIQSPPPLAIETETIPLAPTEVVSLPQTLPASERKRRKHRAPQPLELIKRKGKTIQSLREALVTKRARLTLACQEVLDLAPKSITIDEAARQLGISEPAVRQQVIYLLDSIDRMDHPKKRGVTTKPRTPRTHLRSEIALPYFASPRTWLQNAMEQTEAEEPLGLSQKVFQRWQLLDAAMPEDVTRGPEYKHIDRWLAYADAVRRLVRFARTEDPTILHVMAPLFSETRPLPSLTEIQDALENHIATLFVHAYIDKSSSVPMNLEAMRRAVSGFGALGGHGSVSFINALTDAASSPLAPNLGEHQPFAVYLKDPAAIGAHLQTVADATLRRISMRIYSGETPIRAIQRVVGGGYIRDPFVTVLRTGLTAPDPQEGLRQQTGITFRPSTLFDLASLCDAKPETEEEHDLVDLFSGTGIYEWRVALQFSLKEFITIVGTHLDALPEPNRTILQDHLGLGEGARFLTIEEVGRKYKRTVEDVREIISESLHCIQEILNS